MRERKVKIEKHLMVLLQHNWNNILFGFAAFIREEKCWFTIF